ncbi:MAG: hypothetical protein ACK53L_06240, partial [Pirellulaceae bacterium]
MRQLWKNSNFDRDPPQNHNFQINAPGYVRGSRAGAEEGGQAIAAVKAVARGETPVRVRGDEFRGRAAGSKPWLTASARPSVAGDSLRLYT